MTLFVCNLRYELTDGDLYQLFAQYGLVKAANIALNRDTRASLGDHPKPANGDHLKSGQRIH